MMFSERYGYKPVRQAIQLEDMDETLRVQLWNALDLYYWSKVDEYYTVSKDRYGERIESNIYPLLRLLWHFYYKKPFDTIPEMWYLTYSFIRESFFKVKWFEVYDFIQVIANRDGNVENSKQFVVTCNAILEHELSAYRFVDGQITKITSEVEIQSIEEAIQTSRGKFDGARTHLQAALTLMADRKNPDYRNSIKESISAVEAVCKILAKDDNATLGQALKVIENKQNIILKPAFKSALNTLYGYTSNEDGIRHALLEESTVKFEDAKFMLVTCSAFVNYLIDKSK